MSSPSIDERVRYLHKRMDDYGLRTEWYRKYIMGTIALETNETFLPVREGNLRGKPGFTRENAIRVVQNLFKTGKIRVDYSKPEGPYKNSYFGRGYVQLTHYKNYERVGDLIDFDLVQFPELALNPDIASQIAIRGMYHGWFTGKGLKHVPAHMVGLAKYSKYRNIVNGDRALVARKLNRLAEKYG